MTVAELIVKLEQHQAEARVLLEWRWMAQPLTAVVQEGDVLVLSSKEE